MAAIDDVRGLINGGPHGLPDVKAHYRLACRLLSSP